MDGAHTQESAASLVASVRDAFPAATHPLVLVVAMADDKDARQVCVFVGMCKREAICEGWAP